MMNPERHTSNPNLFGSLNLSDILTDVSVGHLYSTEASGPIQYAQITLIPLTCCFFYFVKYLLAFLFHTLLQLTLL